MMTATFKDKMIKRQSDSEDVTKKITVEVDNGATNRLRFSLVEP